MIVVLTLIVLAATLGVGGYFVYRKMTAAVGVIAAAVGATIASRQAHEHQLLTLQQKRDALPCHRARIVYPPLEKLLAVHNMQAIVGEKVIAAHREERIVVEPMRNTWFATKAIRIVAYAKDVPVLEQRVRIMRCEVNAMPQFDWCSSRMGEWIPGIVSDVFAAPVGMAVAADIAVASDRPNKYTLEFEICNDNPYPVRVVIECYGEHATRVPFANLGSS